MMIYGSGAMDGQRLRPGARRGGDQFLEPERGLWVRGAPEVSTVPTHLESLAGHASPLPPARVVRVAPQ